MMRLGPLPYWLGTFLAEIETRHGPRDMAWTILGVTFDAEEPRTMIYTDRRQVYIALSVEAQTCGRQALFQLAHEVVHLLAPAAGETSVIEEGLAVSYQREIVARHNLDMHIAGPAYPVAGDLVACFLQQHPDGIRRIRAIEPALRNVTPEIIARANPGIDPALARDLCEPFARSRAAA